MGKIKAMFQQELEDAFEKGAIDAYYGKGVSLYPSYKAEHREAYFNGYETEPYGRKEYGYDD